MKKLIFNEGGQPIYLDDLETLQSNNLDQIVGLFRGIMEKTNGVIFLFNPFQYGAYSYGPNSFVYVNGEIIKTTGESIIDTSNNGIYLHVYTENTDDRVMEDGQSKSCGKNTVAQFTRDNTSTVGSLFPVSAAISLMDKIHNKMFEEETVELYADLHLQNGYTGTVKCQKAGSTKRYIVNLTSTNTSWKEDSPVTKNIIPTIFEKEIAGNVCCPLFKIGSNFGTIYKDENKFCLDFVGGTLSQSTPPNVCPIRVVFEML